jgi:type IV pilus assembly protein PilM
MSALASWLAPPTPAVGVEIGTSRVTVVRLAAGGPPATVAGFAVEPLPEGAVTPALNARNLPDPGAVSGAIARALDKAGARGRHAALVVPDTVAKVSLLRFEKVPARPNDLRELIRWQVRKSVPFHIEDAELTYFPGAEIDGAREFVVALARRDVIQEYEGACVAAGLQPGIVDIATFNLINAALAAGPMPEGDWLLVNLAPDYFTVAILRGDALIFIRHRDAEGEGGLADVVHQTAMYYEDRLSGRGFSRVVLAGAGRGLAANGVEAEQVHRQLEGRLQTRVETIDPRPAIALTDRIAADRTLLDAIAPAIGLLLRERTA